MIPSSKEDDNESATMRTAERQEFYTPESYLAFLETTQTKYEFVDGYLRAMSSPTNRHNIVATNATATFWLKLKGSTCRAFNSNSMVRIGKKTSTWMYFPDMSIVYEENRQSNRSAKIHKIVLDDLVQSRGVRNTQGDCSCPIYCSGPAIHDRLDSRIKGVDKLAEL